ncbi:amino acid adenylation domain-containing protein, partial [Pedobacter sp. UYP1]|uniref:amino acid adenylation domain-containing protein n=1 Tax=Pedobacter sp. UYP1 TaxID=1756396 RepID=UPI00339AB27B
RGYLNREALNSARFVGGLFGSSERLYRSGDKVRLLENGEMEYGGRMDDQVKIRGYRIELGEIEHALLQQPGIEDVVVLARADEWGETSLVAYVVGKGVLETSSLRTALAVALPSYMLPGHFVQLAGLPLTANGKVNKQALPAPQGLDLETGVAYVEAGSATEIALVGIWEKLLAREKISIKDSFFDLGGHSLKAMRLVSELRREFEVKIALKDIFENPVLEELGRLIDRSQGAVFTAIPQVALQADYPLSSSQRRLWILSQFTEGSIAYNMPGAYVFEGQLNTMALDYAFNNLIERHEILRTVFDDENGKIRQLVKTPDQFIFNIEYLDLSEEDQKEEQLRILIEQDSVQPFNLATGPLLRAGVYQLKTDQWVFSYVMHHIISDGWSMGALIKELLLLYNSYVQGQVSPLTPLRIQYKDYAAWQQEQLTGARLNSHQHYWLDQFSGELPVLALPADKVRPAMKTYNGSTVSSMMGLDVSKGIRSFVQKYDSTLFMGLLAGLNTLLYRYSGQDDIIVGTPIAGREHSDLDDQLGFYANTLALRTKFKGTENFTDLLLQIRELTLNAYEHQVYPFDQLVNDLQLQRDMSRSALFDVMLVLQNAETIYNEQQSLEGLKISGYEGNKQVISKFDLTFTFIERGEDIQLVIEFNNDIFNERTIIQLADHFMHLFQVMLSEPAVPIKSIDYLSASEKKNLLFGFNQTAVTYPKGKTVIDLFEEQVNSMPDQIAIMFGELSLTYQELNEKANVLGRYLKEQYEIYGDDRIAIQLERSEWTVIAILGVLKSGGAYVPVDSGYPQERIDYLLADSGCKVVLNDDELLKFKLVAATYSKENLQLPIQNKDLAYVIYTSGSTGLPKGCAITHSSLFNYIFWADSYYFKGKGQTNFGLYTSLSFDLTVTSIFCSLTLGGKLLVYGPHEEVSEILSHSFSLDSGLNCIKLTPSHINMLEHLDIEETNITCVIVGGEEVSMRHVEILKKISPSLVIYNEYGPTEATVGCIVKELEAKKAVLIGKPIANTAIYILENASGLSPVGVVGEICIGGFGLAKEYLNNRELTENKFINNPFNYGERMYLTGDLGRWLEDGNIEYLGRRDEQVKIRGYRIELGEIENALYSYAEVDGAVVISRPAVGGEKELVAYVTAKKNLDIMDLRAYLSTSLPIYMLPASFVQLESLPLTSNGKVDKKLLMSTVAGRLNSGTAYIAPGNEIEEKLVLIWQEVLGKERIGVYDNFFEIGGNSILIILLAKLASKALNKEITITTLFQYPNIKNLAGYFREETPEYEEELLDADQLFDDLDKFSI